EKDVPHRLASHRAGVADDLSQRVDGVGGARPVALIEATGTEQRAERRHGAAVPQEALRELPEPWAELVDAAEAHDLAQVVDAGRVAGRAAGQCPQVEHGAVPVEKGAHGPGLVGRGADDVPRVVERGRLARWAAERSQIDDLKARRER